MTSDAQSQSPKPPPNELLYTAPLQPTHSLKISLSALLQTYFNLPQIVYFHLLKIVGTGVMGKQGRCYKKKQKKNVFLQDMGVFGMAYLLTTKKEVCGIYILCSEHSFTMFIFFSVAPLAVCLNQWNM